MWMYDIGYENEKRWHHNLMYRETHSCYRRFHNLSDHLEINVKSSSPSNLAQIIASNSSKR
jgi:hypothetical protein